MRFIVWTVDYSGTNELRLVEGANLREALSDAGLCHDWLLVNIEPPSTSTGVFDLWGDKVFDIDNAEAVATMGQRLAMFVITNQQTQLK